MNKILIVDDEPSALEIMGDFLKAKGLSIAEATDGEEALKKAESFQPCVILLDIRMPKMDGMEALQWMKSSSPDSQIIMTTAVAEVDTAVSCMKKGAFNYLTKPIDLKKMSLEIERALEHRIIQINLKNPQHK